MNLDKVDFLHKDYGSNVYEGNHHEIFAETLLKHIKRNQDFLITSDWSDIRENTLVIVFDYEGFHDDLAKYQQNAHEFYRRIFIIGWQYDSLASPNDYQDKSFAGNLYVRAYNIIMEGRKASIDDPAFYADNWALDALRAGAVKPDYLWCTQKAFMVNDEGDKEKALTYELVSCNMDIVQVLGMYLDEYMEKYDDLKLLDKFAEDPVMPVIPVVKRHYELPEEFVINRRDLGSISLPAQAKQGDELKAQLTIYPPFLKGDATTLYPIKLTFFKVPNEESNDYGFWAEETQQIRHDGVNYILEGDMILYFDPSKVQWEG